MEKITSFFKILSDITRLQIVLILLFHGETCVCQFTRCLDAPQSLVSRHLRILRDHGLVDTEHRKQWVYYRIRAELDPLERSILEDLKKEYGKDPFITSAMEEIRNNPC